MIRNQISKFVDWFGVKKTQAKVKECVSGTDDTDDVRKLKDFISKEVEKLDCFVICGIDYKYNDEFLNLDFKIERPNATDQQLIVLFANVQDYKNIHCAKYCQMTTASNHANAFITFCWI